MQIVLKNALSSLGKATRFGEGFSDFKPKILRLKIELVSHTAHGGGSLMKL